MIKGYQNDFSKRWSVNLSFIYNLLHLCHHRAMVKKFNEWNKLKIQLDRNHNLPTFQEREIWWCSIGLNIGHEQDGKNNLYNRPVLVVRKFNKKVFWGVPLTTKIKKNNRYYIQITFHHRPQCAIISQMRLWDGKRLTNKMGQLPEKQFENIRSSIKNLL